MFKFSSIKKVSSKKWLIQESKNYTKLAAIYDKLNNFKESDRILAHACSMIRLAQEQNDEKEPDVDYQVDEVDPNTINPEEDIEDQFLRKFSKPGYDRSTAWSSEALGLHPGNYGRNEELIKITDYKSTLGSQINIINDFIKALSLGGNNVAVSLKSLSPVFAEVQKTSGDSDTLRCLNTALAHYYNNPIFLKFKESLFNGYLYNLFVFNLEENKIDANTVKLIEDVNNKKKLRVETYNLHLDSVKKILSEANIPLEHDILAYFYGIYSLKNFNDDILVFHANKFNYENFKFAKSIFHTDRHTTDKFSDVFKIVNFLGIDAVKKYMEIHNISKLTSFHHNNLVKFKTKTGHDFDPDSKINQNIIIPYIKEVASLLLDVFVRKATGLTDLTFVAMKTAFTPEEFAQKVKDDVIRLDDEFHNNIFYVSNHHILSQLRDEDLNYLQSNINGFNFERDFVIVKLYLERGKEIVPFINKNYTQFQFTQNDAPRSYSDDRGIKVPPIFDLRLFYDYLVKYEEDLHVFNSHGMHPYHDLNRVYSIFGPRIIDLYPLEIILIAGSTFNNGAPLDENFQITPDLLISRRGKYDIDYILRNKHKAYQILIDQDYVEMQKNLIKKFFDNNFKDRDALNYMLFSLGDIDLDWYLTFRASLDYEKIKPDLAEPLKQIKDRNFFLGNLSKLQELETSDDIHKDSLRTLYTDLPLAQFESKYNKVKDTMMRTPAYKHLVPNTLEYEKVFLMIYINFWTRNRNLSVWTTLFDDTIKFRIMAGLTNMPFKEASILIDDFSDATLNQMEDIKQNIGLTRDKIKNMYFQPYFTLRYEIQIDDGNYSKENVDKYLNGSTNQFMFVNRNSILLHHMEDLKFISDKFADYYVKNFIKLPENYGLQHYNRHFLAHHLEKDKLSDDEFESILRKIITGKIDISNKNVILPQYAYNFALANITDTVIFENLGYAAAILHIFNNSSFDVLNSFAKRRYGNNYSQLSLEDKKEVIHDLGNILPSKRDQNFVGFAEYFMNNYSQANKMDLRLVGNNWSSYIKLYDTKFKLIGDNYLVRNLANLKDENNNKKYDLQSLAKAIKTSSMSELIENVEDPNEIMLFEFSNHYGAGSDTEFSTEQSIELFSSLQEVYLRGQNVPLPNWASFDKTIRKDNKTEIRLRFLPRNDVRGMFLGHYAECCQHPTSYASTCAIDGHVNPKSAFIVFEINGQLGAEGYVWTADDNVIVIDSLETIGNEFYHSSRNKKIMEDLLIDFANSLGNIEVRIGSGPINFDDFELAEKREIIIHDDEFVIEEYKKFFNEFAPPGYGDSMYSDAKNVQSIVPKST